MRPDEPTFAPRATLERRLRLTMLLPIAVTVLLAGALIGELLLMLDSSGWVDHSDQVIAHARHMGVLVADRTIALDRYLSTGDATQLAALGDQDRSLSGALAALGRLVADNPAQGERHQRLALAVSDWRQSIGPMVVHREALAREQEAELQRRTNELTLELNRQLSDFVVVEARLREERSHRTHQLSRLAVGGTLLSALLLGGVLGLFARRSLRAVATEYEAALGHVREQALLLSEEERFRRLIEAVEDYAIFLLDVDGNVSSWNAGAERGTGWSSSEILGQPYARFFTPDDRSAEKPRHELEVATERGVARAEDRRVRKDGTQFVAEVTLTAVRDAAGRMVGFVSIARDITDRRRTEAAIAALNSELERRVAELAAANGELETFSYSVSHDLRGPLRAIDGFSKILMDDYRERLDAQGQHYLARVRAGSQRMGHLIDDLLSLARVTRAEMHRSDVDLAQIAREIIEEERRRDPTRVVEVVIVDHAPASGDPWLLRTALENLLGNAWKFTGRSAHPRIELGVERVDGISACYVRDNGAGFDMSYVHKLFAPFQRLHEQSEFEGTGIGLATVQRIIARHGGKLWAQATPGQGATFWFTVESA